MTERDIGEATTDRSMRRTGPAEPRPAVAWLVAILAWLAAAALGAPDAAAREGGNGDPRLPRVIVDMPEPTPGAPATARAAMPAPRPAPEEPAEAPAAEPETAEPETAEPGTAAPAEPPVDDPSLPAWQRYARPFEDPAGRPRIAILVGGLGLSEALTLQAIDRLPGAVTLGVAAHAPDRAGMVAAARGDGHEVVMTVPMEPLAYPRNDPGPSTLLTSLAPRHNLTRLEALLGGAEGCVGVVSDMGARFVASPDAIRPVLRRLGEEGMLFVERRPVERSAAARIGREVDLPYIAGDRVLDAGLAPDLLDFRLVELEHIARDRGHALAIAEPTPMLIERLAEWAASLPDKGLVLAPVTAVATAEPAL